jgi:AcrR family transcriptional regulator
MATVAYGTGRRALLEAAIKVVADQGLRGLTFRTVAAEAGVTQGLIRHHFGDWASLLEEALLLSLERSIDGGELESDGPGFDGFARGLAQLVARDPATQLFQYELALESRRRPELAPIMVRVYEAYREAVQRELVRNGMDDPDLARAVFSALDGLVFQQVVFGETEATDRAISALRSLLRAYASAEV